MWEIVLFSPRICAKNAVLVSLPKKFLTEEIMKKFVKFLALPIVAATLCGCSGALPFTKKTPDFSVNQSLTAEIKSGNLEAKANVSRNDGEWEFAFTEPKTLGGIVVKLGEKGVDGHLGSLSFVVDDNQSYALYPEIIAKTIDSLDKIPAEKISAKDGVLTIETDFEGSKTTVSADENTGKLISLKCPQYKLAVNFSDSEKAAENPEKTSEISASNSSENSSAQ